jgi:hypothetical protein
MQIQSIDPTPFHALSYAYGPGASSQSASLLFLRALTTDLPEGLDAIIAAADLQGFGGDDCDMPLGECLAHEVLRLQARGQLPPKERMACLLAGDLHPRADAGDVRGAWYAMREACRWVAGVAGNHDKFGEDAGLTATRAELAAAGMYLLDDETADVDGLKLGGVGGIVGAATAAGVRSEGDFADAVRRLANDGVDVLLCHDGPDAGAAGQPGWPSVRHALEAARPTLVIRGHDSWTVPLATLRGGTQVLNVEGRVVVLTRTVF